MGMDGVLLLRMYNFSPNAEGSGSLVMAIINVASNQYV